MDIPALIGAVLGALIVGAIAADRSGKWFLGGFIGFFAGVIVIAALRAARNYFGEASRDPSTRAEHKHIYIVLGAFVVALLVYGSLKPESVILPPIPHVAQPVEVSGYSRSDGTDVSSYNRALPGERQRNNQGVHDWATAGGRRLDTYYSERNRALLWAVGVFGVGCFWAYRVRNHASQRL